MNSRRISGETYWYECRPYFHIFCAVLVVMLRINLAADLFACAWGLMSVWVLLARRRNRRLELQRQQHEECARRIARRQRDRGLSAVTMPNGW